MYAVINHLPIKTGIDWAASQPRSTPTMPESHIQISVG